MFLLYLIIANTEAAKAHAKQFAQVSRPWGYSAFYTALSEERSEGERKEIMELFYKRIEEYLIGQDPVDYGGYYVMGYMHVKKIAE